MAILTSGCLAATSDIGNVSKQRQIATVFVSHFLTMDEAQPTASAVGVADGKIIAVGNLPDVKKALSAYQIRIDHSFAKNTVLPGFIDNHLHPTLAGILLPTAFITPFSWDLPNQKVSGVQGKANYLARLKKLLAKEQVTEPIFITWGYHADFHGDLQREELDSISGNRPVIVWHRSFHEVIMNSAAIALLGIDDAAFGNHPAIDLPRGHFWELGLFSIFPKLAPIVLSAERMKTGMLVGLRHAQANGITTVADQGSPLLDLDMELNYLNAVFQESKVPLRMLMIPNGKSLSTMGIAQGLQTIEQISSRNTTDVRFLAKQVKLLADGAFYSQLMQMEDGYLDGHHGEWIMPPQELEEAARLFWNAGYQLHIHVNGDKGLNVVLNIIAKLNNEFPRDHKTVLHHYGYATENHAERLVKLGISVSANPYYLWALGDKYAEVGLGPERAHAITRLGDLERNGVSISLHSDLPMAPAAPLKLASIAASRISAAGNLLAPKERISVLTALRGITIEAARAIQQEHLIGSIEVGKNADFTVLGQDPLTVSARQIEHIAVHATVVGGEIHRLSKQPNVARQ